MNTYEKVKKFFMEKKIKFDEEEDDYALTIFVDTAANSFMRIYKSKRNNKRTVITDFTDWEGYLDYEQKRISFEHLKEQFYGRY